MVLLLAGCAGSQQVGPVMEPTPVAVPEAAPLGPPTVDTDVVYFEPGETALDHRAREVLATIGVWLEEAPGHRVEIIVGDDSTEQTRAETAREFLLYMGFAPDRVALVETPPPAPAPGLHTVELAERATEVEVQVEAEPSVPIERSFALQQPPEPAPGLLRDLGIGVSAGAGIVTFLDDEASDIAGPGAGWDVRLTLGTNHPVSLEAAYLGSAQEIDALGLDDDAVLLSTGAEATLRFALSRNRPLTPYLIAGIGWARFSIENSDVNTSNLADSDDVISVPLGVGVSVTSGPVIVDVRSVLRSTLDEDLVPPSATGETVDLNNWSLAVRAGWQL
jgi:hypothetical protein